MLDVSRLREDLLEFLLRDGNRPAVLAEDDRPAGGRSLVESENAHGESPGLFDPREAGRIDDE